MIEKRGKERMTDVGKMNVKKKNIGITQVDGGGGRGGVGWKEGKKRK